MSVRARLRVAIPFVGGLLVGAGLLLPSAAPQSQKPKEPGRFLSPLGLTVDPKGERAYVALHTADAVAVVDLKEGKLLHEIAVGKRPTAVGLIKDRLYVACEGDDTLVVVDIEQRKVLRRLAVDQAPVELTVARDGKQVIVVCRDASSLVVLDVETDRLKRIDVAGFPERVAVGPESLATVYPLQGGREQGTMAHVNLHEGTASKVHTGMSNMRGLALTADGRRLAAHQRPKTHVPATQVAQGWVFTNALRVSGLLSSEVAILDEPNRGYADPSDMAVSADGRQALVAASGADQVLVVDLGRLSRFVEKRNSSRPLYYGRTDDATASDDLTASRHYVVARLPVQANPRRLALSGDGKTLVVSNYLGDSLSVIDAGKLSVVRHIDLGGSKPDAARRGEILFHSGKMTFQGQFTCASCHPNGGADGLNWDLERDGVGTFKNTKSLLGLKGTEPFGWHGSSATLADRVRGTLRTLHRHEPTEGEVEDLVAYLESLPPPRPLPSKEKEKEAFDRGQKIFAGKGDCRRCHHRTNLDDDKTHNVGTRGRDDTQDRFDTPGLLGVVRTAPYLHDGRAATLEEIFTKHNARNLHGAAHELSDAEFADLMAYLQGL